MRLVCKSTLDPMSTSALGETTCLKAALQALGTEGTTSHELAGRSKSCNKHMVHTSHEPCSERKAVPTCRQLLNFAQQVLRTPFRTTSSSQSPSNLTSGYSCRFGLLNLPSCNNLSMSPIRRISSTKVRPGMRGR